MASFLGAVGHRLSKSAGIRPKGGFRVKPIMLRTWKLGLAGLSAAIALGGCATSPPKTEAKRSALQEEAEAALQTMEAKDPSLKPTLKAAYGYAIFPTVTQGGAVVGGATGRGVAYQQGKMVGYVELNQASVGAQLGGQSFSELLVFSDPGAFANLKTGTFGFGADASAVGVTEGAAASARFENGVAAFVMQKSGLMFNLSLNGQRLTYTPATAYGGSGAK
jgi:lipid-binding SYLF domain-containing protein